MAKFDMTWLYVFFKNCEITGKPFNTMEKIKLMMKIREDKLDEVMDMINKFRPSKKYTHSIKIDANIHQPDIFNGSSHDAAQVWNGTSIHVPATVHEDYATGTSIVNGKWIAKTAVSK